MIKKISLLLLAIILLLGGRTARCQWTTNNPGTNIAGGSGFGTNYSRTNVGGSYTFNTNYSRTNLSSTGYSFNTNYSRTNLSSTGYSFNTNYSRTNLSSTGYSYNTNYSRTNVGGGYTFNTNYSRTNLNSSGSQFSSDPPAVRGRIITTNLVAIWITNVEPVFAGAYVFLSADSTTLVNAGFNGTVNKGYTNSNGAKLAYDGSTTTWAFGTNSNLQCSGRNAYRQPQPGGASPYSDYPTGYYSWTYGFAQFPGASNSVSSFPIYSYTTNYSL